MTDDDIYELALSAYRVTRAVPLRGEYYRDAVDGTPARGCAVGVTVCAAERRPSKLERTATWLERFADLTGRTQDFADGVVGGFDTRNPLGSLDSFHPEWQRGYAVGVRIAQAVFNEMELT